MMDQVAIDSIEPSPVLTASILAAVSDSDIEISLMLCFGIRGAQGIWNEGHLKNVSVQCMKFVRKFNKHDFLDLAAVHSGSVYSPCHLSSPDVTNYCNAFICTFLNLWMHVAVIIF